MPTILEWLDTVPRLNQRMVVGRTIPRGPKTKELPDGETVLSPVIHVASTQLWLIVIGRCEGPGKYMFRVRVWLRNLDGTLLLIEDNESGFVTVRGAEWWAFRVLNKLTEDMREADRAFVETVEGAVEEEVSQ